MFTKGVYINCLQGSGYRDCIPLDGWHLASTHRHLLASACHDEQAPAASRALLAVAAHRLDQLRTMCNNLNLASFALPGSYIFQFLLLTARWCNVLPGRVTYRHMVWFCLHAVVNVSICRCAAIVQKLAQVLRLPCSDRAWKQQTIALSSCCLG